MGFEDSVLNGNISSFLHSISDNSDYECLSLQAGASKNFTFVVYLFVETLGMLNNHPTYY